MEGSIRLDAHESAALASIRGKQQKAITCRNLFLRGERKKIAYKLLVVSAILSSVLAVLFIGLRVAALNPPIELAYFSFCGFIGVALCESLYVFPRSIRKFAELHPEEAELISIFTN
jgi:hypothetical protein